MARGPEPRRAFSTRAQSSSSSSFVPRSRTVREASGRRGDRMMDYSEIEPNPYGDEYYGDGREPLRRGPVGSIRQNLSRRPPSRERYVEDDEYASDAREGSSVDEEFEILDARSIRSMRSASSRRPDVKKVWTPHAGASSRWLWA
jgi:hypothetical protein